MTCNFGGRGVWVVSSWISSMGCTVGTTRGGASGLGGGGGGGAEPVLPAAGLALGVSTLAATFGSAGFWVVGLVVVVVVVIVVGFGVVVVGFGVVVVVVVVVGFGVVVVVVGFGVVVVVVVGFGVVVVVVVVGLAVVVAATPLAKFFGTGMRLMKLLRNEPKYK